MKKELWPTKERAELVEIAGALNRLLGGTAKTEAEELRMLTAAVIYHAQKMNNLELPETDAADARDFWRDDTEIFVADENGVEFPDHPLPRDGKEL
jgi:hypothetical protein